jgi:hypothetical protein
MSADLVLTILCGTSVSTLRPPTNRHAFDRGTIDRSQIFETRTVKKPDVIARLQSQNADHMSGLTAADHDRGFIQLRRLNKKSPHHRLSPDS